MAGDIIVLSGEITRRTIRIAGSIGTHNGISGTITRGSGGGGGGGSSYDTVTPTTQSNYTALAEKDSGTLYVIQDPNYYNAATRIYHGDQKIWDLNAVPPSPGNMPVTDGFITYFDCERNVNAEYFTWTDVFGRSMGFNNTGYGGRFGQNSVTKEVFIKENMYGFFDSTYSQNQIIYIVFKVSSLENLISFPIYICGRGTGLTAENANTGQFFATYLNSSGNIVFSTHGYAYASSVNGLSYHVICMVRDSNNTNSFYIDGELVYTVDISNAPPVLPNKVAVGAAWMSNQAILDSYHNDLYLRCIAVGNELHTAAQIRQNSLWLKSHYNF